MDNVSTGIAQSEGLFHIVDTFEEVKWITGYEYCFDIPKDYREHAVLKRWCLENCDDVVCYIMRNIGREVKDRIYFYSECDAMAYKLRWD